MQIKTIDAEKYAGFKCPDSGLYVDFLEPGPEALKRSCVLGLIENEVPESSYIIEKEPFCSQWKEHYAKSMEEDESLMIDEIIESFEGGAIALSYTDDVGSAYFVVPQEKYSVFGLVVRG